MLDCCRLLFTLCLLKNTLFHFEIIFSSSIKNTYLLSLSLRFLEVIITICKLTHHFNFKNFSFAYRPAFWVIVYTVHISSFIAGLRLKQDFQQTSSELEPLRFDNQMYLFIHYLTLNPFIWLGISLYTVLSWVSRKLEERWANFKSASWLDDEVKSQLEKFSTWIIALNES